MLLYMTTVQQFACRSKKLKRRLSGCHDVRMCQRFRIYLEFGFRSLNPTVKIENRGVSRFCEQGPRQLLRFARLPVNSLFAKLS
jgi:hypothetical protein